MTMDNKIKQAVNDIYTYYEFAKNNSDLEIPKDLELKMYEGENFIIQSIKDYIQIKLQNGYSMKLPFDSNLSNEIIAAYNLNSKIPGTVKMVDDCILFFLKNMDEEL